MTRVRAWTVALALLWATCFPAHAGAPWEVRHAEWQPGSGVPRPDAWQPVQLPAVAPEASWFRLRFEAPAQRAESWSVYLPYLEGGGAAILNGSPLGSIGTATAGIVTRWERPFLFVIPESLLRPGANELLVHVATSSHVLRARMPLPSVGPHSDLLSAYEKRAFLKRTMPQFTVAACAVVGLLVLFIWWRRPDEKLYGLFGLAVLLWGGRTLTFVIETLPADLWPLWRLFYHSATGGFIIVLTVFALRLSGIARPGIEFALAGYWLLGPLAYLASGGSETLLTRVWTGGLIPIGLALLVTSVMAAARQRTWDTVLLSAALGVGVLSGVHDYLLVTGSPLLTRWAPEWAGQRIFTLHYGANSVLLAMAAILSARFVAALQTVEQLNRTLETRVQDRERALVENYQRLSELQRQHAAHEERQRIMTDLHDGLGSQLFVTLSRVESRQIGLDAISQALRDCIAEMRLALEVAGPAGHDFRDAWGSFRHRWERQLEAAGLTSTWVTPEAAVPLPGGTALQLLRIVQEALTNVLKHAQARHVDVRLEVQQAMLLVQVRDDGRGMQTPSGNASARGLGNIRSRAARLGGSAHWRDAAPGTCVELVIPLPEALQP